MNKKLDIIPFDLQYSNRFYDLNVEWLEKYFYVEPYDKKVLSNPQEYIIDNGGYIFFAKFNDVVVGTVALINQSTFFELSKMAVSPKYQGLKIGQQLMNHCIDFAKQQDWKSITLYSHRSLGPAINLYKKVGFVEVELEKDSHYERSDIKMKLDL
jgi:ribosomal protein S18 acetylase RimI-like enzyme